MLITDKPDSEESQASKTPLDQATCSDIELRLQVLHLAKEVLQGKAAMRWETHKQIEDITIDSLITESIKLYNFVTDSQT